MIDDILSKAVEFYKESQELNYGKSLSTEIARRELLGCGRVYFKIPGTETSIPSFDNSNAAMPSPIIADCEGVFPTVIVKRECTMTIYNREGLIIKIANIGTAQFKL